MSSTFPPQNDEIWMLAEVGGSGAIDFPLCLADAGLVFSKNFSVSPHVFWDLWLRGRGFPCSFPLSYFSSVPVGSWELEASRAPVQDP